MAAGGCGRFLARALPRMAAIGPVRPAAGPGPRVVLPPGLATRPARRAGTDASGPAASAAGFHFPEMGAAPLEAIPKPEFIDASAPAEIAVTTLDNGLMVATTEEGAGSWSCINVIVGVGPRHETPDLEGAAYFLDRLAFRSTSKYSHADMIRQLQEIGGNFTCTSNRESMMYSATVFNNDLEDAVDILSEVVLRPNFTQAEVEQQLEIMEWEQKEIVENPDVFLPELIHLAAYGDRTLGLPHVCANSQEVTPEQIHRFHDQHYVAPKMVVTGVGVEHGVMVELAKRCFGSMPAGVEVPPTQPAVYVGDQRLYAMEKSPDNNALGVQLTQVALGFKGVSWYDDDLYAFAVLQMLLGGGLSFSVGGPGKGVFTRMYTYVLNQYTKVYRAVAMNLSYEDSGIFFLEGAAPPDQAQLLMDLFVNQMDKLVREGVTVSELERAKRQLMAALLFNLESKPIVAEDIGRQILAFKKRLSAEELIERIDMVTPDDIQRVSHLMVSSRPSVAAYGDVTKLEKYDYFRDKIAGIAAHR